MTVSVQSALRIFLIDDNPTDAVLLSEACRRASRPVELESEVSPADALERLQASALAGTLPHLLLVDVNMPEMTGMEFVDRLDAIASIADLPYVAYSTSNRVEDIQAMYARRCGGYVIKPVDFADLLCLVEDLHRYWRDRVTLPSVRRR